MTHYDAIRAEIIDHIPQIADSLQVRPPDDEERSQLKAALLPVSITIIEWRNPAQERVRIIFHRENGPPLATIPLGLIRKIKEAHNRSGAAT